MKKSDLYVLGFASVLLILFSVNAFPTLSFPFFIWDDSDFLFDKVVIGGSIRDVITIEHYGMYHPVTTVYSKYSYLLHGNNPIVLHSIATIIHLLNSILVFVISRRLTKNTYASIFAYSIFLFHPLSVEVYIWLSNIKDLLYVMFSLWSIILYLEYKNGGYRIGRYFYAYTVVSLMAIMSKPQAIVLPLIFLLFDYYYNRSWSLKLFLDKLVIVIVALGSLIINLYFRNHYHDLSSIPTFSFLNHLMVSSMVFIHYLFSALLPIKLSVFYPYSIQNQLIVPFINSLFAIGYLLFFVYSFIKKRKKVVLIMGLGIILLIPVIQIIPIGDSMYNDRYSYFYLFSFALGAAFLFKSLSNYSKLRQTVSKVLAVIFLVFLVYSTFNRTNQWSSEVKLFEHDYLNYPNSEILANTLGSCYDNKGDQRKAIEYFDVALKLDPNYVQAYYNKALAYEKLGNFNSASRFYRNAIEVRPTYKKALFRLSRIDYLLNENDKAYKGLKTLVKIKPVDAETYHLYGQVMYKYGDIKGSIRLYKQAIILDNRNATYLYNLAVAYGSNNNLNSAIDVLNIAISINPRFKEAYYLRGIAKIRNGQNGCIDLKKAEAYGDGMATKALRDFCN